MRNTFQLAVPSLWHVPTAPAFGTQKPPTRETWPWNIQVLQEHGSIKQELPQGRSWGRAPLGSLPLHFSRGVLQIAVFWVPPPTTLLLGTSWEVRRAVGWWPESAEHRCSDQCPNEEDSPEHLYVSLSFENDLLNHSASKNWIWCFKETCSNLWMIFFLTLWMWLFLLHECGWDSQSVSVHIHHLQTPHWTKCTREDSKHNFLCQLIELGEMLA